MSRNFIWIIGPIAVGKMTVGQRISEKTNYKFMHNHQSIEFALNYFEYGSEGFNKINGGIRNLVFRTIAEKEEKGFIFTFVWAFDSDKDHEYVKQVNTIFSNWGWDIYYVELEAGLEIRKKRNVNPDRIAAKPSKKDTNRTRKEIVDLSEKYQLNSYGDFPYPDNHIKINNEQLTPDEVSDKVIQFCGIK